MSIKLGLASHSPTDAHSAPVFVVVDGDDDDDDDDDDGRNELETEPQTNKPTSRIELSK